MSSMRQSLQHGSGSAQGYSQDESVIRRELARSDRYPYNIRDPTVWDDQDGSASSECSRNSKFERIHRSDSGALMVGSVHTSCSSLQVLGSLRADLALANIPGGPPGGYDVVHQLRRSIHQRHDFSLHPHLNQRPELECEWKATIQVPSNAVDYLFYRHNGPYQSCQGNHWHCLSLHVITLHVEE